MNPDQRSSLPCFTLPPKQRYQLLAKRTLSDLEHQDEHQAGGQQEGEGRQQQKPQEEEEDFEEEELDFLTKKHTVSPKLVKLSTSKIQGLANPRKPRIGSQYQAVVPEWPSQQQAPPLPQLHQPPPRPGTDTPPGADMQE